MANSRLTAQDISLPAKGSTALNPAEFPGLRRHAGQRIDTSDKATAYANQFINVHLASVAGLGDFVADLRIAAHHIRQP